MSLKRRDIFKLAGLTAVATVAPIGINASTSSKKFAKKASGKSVVIVGAGFGGLTMAKELRKLDNSIEVTVLEKKDTFMACPFSNTYLGGLENVSLEDLMHDYYEPSVKHGYSFVQAEVTAIDRESKVVTSTSGKFNYDILVLSPGIAYDYEKQFPSWSNEKISKVARECPAAFIPGSEHLALKRQLNNMDDGDVIIVPPTHGKYRCPPAPFERASMVAHYMNSEGIKGKVVVLDTRNGKFSKGKAFKESWDALYSERIDYKGMTTIIDVDVDAKTITYLEYSSVDAYEEEDTSAAIKKIHKYEVCNIIPLNKCSPVTKMADIETNAAGFAMMDGYTFRSASDKNVYVIGDAVGHKVPPSGQSAIWGAKRAATQVAAQINGKSFDAVQGLPANAANVCYSMVNGKPDEAIMVTHVFVADESGVIKGKGSVPKPKDGNGKYRSKGIGRATREWFSGIKRELFT